MKAQIKTEALQGTLRRLRPFFPDTVFTNCRGQYVRIDVCDGRITFTAHAQGITAQLTPALVPSSDPEDGSALIPFMAFFRAIEACRDQEYVWLLTLSARGFLVATDLSMIIYESSYSPSPQPLAHTTDQNPPERLPDKQTQPFQQPAIYHGEIQASADSPQIAPLFFDLASENVSSCLQLLPGQVWVTTTDKKQFRHDLVASADCKDTATAYLSSPVARILARFLSKMHNRVRIQAEHGFLVFAGPSFTLTVPQLPAPAIPFKAVPKAACLYQCQVHLSRLQDAIRLVYSASPSPFLALTIAGDTWQFLVPAEYRSTAPGFTFPYQVEGAGNSDVQELSCELHADLLLATIKHYRQHGAKSAIVRLFPKVFFLEVEGDGWQGQSFLPIRPLATATAKPKEQETVALPALSSLSLS